MWSQRNDFITVMDEADEPMCWRLLAQCGVGRIGFVEEGHLQILPVNLVAIDGTVVFRTSTESALSALAAGADVVVEADRTERVSESGWSVVVRGRAGALTDEQVRLRATETSLHSWAPGEHDLWIVVTPHTVTGRVVYRRRVIAPGAHVPYMTPD